MGAVRYRCDFYSDGGQQWRVDIYDSASSVGSPADFNIFGTGFDLSYKGTDSETYSPLLASEVKLYFAIEDSDAQDMLMEILNTNEKRFFIQKFLVKFYKPSILIFIFINVFASNFSIPRIF